MTAAAINGTGNPAHHQGSGRQGASSGERIYYPCNFRDIDEMVENCWSIIRQELRQRGYAASEVKIHMALAEALINAWKHGHRRDQHLPITFRWCFNHNFTFEVLDQGPGFNFRTLPDPTNGERRTADHGRGIFIIRTFARAVGWRDQGRHLIVTFSQP